MKAAGEEMAARGQARAKVATAVAMDWGMPGLMGVWVEKGRWGQMEAGGWLEAGMAAEAAA